MLSHVFWLTAPVIASTTLLGSTLGRGSAFDSAWAHTLLRGGSGFTSERSLEPEEPVSEDVGEQLKISPLPLVVAPTEPVEVNPSVFEQASLTLPEETLPSLESSPPQQQYPPLQSNLPAIQEDSSTQYTTSTTNRTITVFQNFWSRLFPTHLGDCCIVGSSDALNGARRGPEIDAHQTVIRVNRLPNLEYYADFGQRTDVAVLNRLLSRKGLLEFLGGEYLDCIDDHEVACDIRAVVLKEVSETTAPRWLRAPFPVGAEDHSIRQVANEMLQNVIPSTGFTAFLTFVPMCDTVTLYGFGPGEGTADGHVLKTEENSEGYYHDLQAEHKILERISLGETNFQAGEGMAWQEELFRSNLLDPPSWLWQQLGSMHGRVNIVG